MNEHDRATILQALYAFISDASSQKSTNWLSLKHEDASSLNNNEVVESIDSICYPNTETIEHKPTELSSNQQISSEIWVCGSNTFGQLGLENQVITLWSKPKGLEDKNILCIQSKHGHSVAIDSNGHVYTCGRNDCGQLGLGDYAQRSTFTHVTALQTRITHVECGDQFTLFLDEQGKLFACGKNENGFSR